jgi:hypothetical protein
VRSERIIGLLGMILAGLLYWAGAGHDFAAAYQFPGLAAIAMAVFALVLLALTWTPYADRTAVVETVPWRRLWPGLLVLALYMASAEQLGFLVSGLLAFVSIGLVYAAPRPGANYRRCLPIALAFMTVLYLIFVELLQVQLPRGWLI